jgi:opacity protein-like surface antigen
LALGRNLVPAARAELDLHWGKVCYKAQSDSGINLHQIVKLSGFSVNGYYDILRAKLISPYVTAGAGLGINDAKDLMADSTRVQGKRTKSFIWNVGLGARMKLSSRFDVDLGYRYMYLGKTRTTKSDPIGGLSGVSQYVAGTQKIYGNQFLAGASYHF